MIKVLCFVLDESATTLYPSEKNFSIVLFTHAWLLSLIAIQRNHL